MSSGVWAIASTNFPPYLLRVQLFGIWFVFFAAHVKMTCVQYSLSDLAELCLYEGHANGWAMIPDWVSRLLVPLSLIVCDYVYLTLLFCCLVV